MNRETRFILLVQSLLQYYLQNGRWTDSQISVRLRPSELLDCLNDAGWYSTAQSALIYTRELDELAQEFVDGWFKGEPTCRKT